MPYVDIRVHIDDEGGYYQRPRLERLGDSGDLDTQEVFSLTEGLAQSDWLWTDFPMDFIEKL